MKNKSFIKYICLFIILTTFFVVSLISISMFSSKSIHNNVKESVDVLLKEGNRKLIYIPYRDSNIEFDNFTDALMLNTAYSIDPQKPLYSAFVARKNYLPNVTTVIYPDEVGELKSSSEYKDHNEVAELNDLINGKRIESFEYARYWHGYLIVLRPLFLLFNITQLRVILTILLILLAVILFILISKKIDVITAIIFLLSLFSVEYFYLGFSLQGIFVFLIAVIVSIILIKRYDKIKNYGLLFFLIGMLTNFFDFLTVPLVTLAMPLTIYFLLKQRNISFRAQIIEFIKLSIIWGVGYILTWFTKWLLVDVIYNKNMISIAIKQILYRSIGNEPINLLAIILLNINYIAVTFNISLFVMVGITIVRRILIINKKSNNMLKQVDLKNILLIIFPYILIAIMPFIWYILLRNHSWYHAFFSYRNLFLTVLGINLTIFKAIEMFINPNNKKEE